MLPEQLQVDMLKLQKENLQLEQEKLQLQISLLKQHLVRIQHKNWVVILNTA